MPPGMRTVKGWRASTTWSRAEVAEVVGPEAADIVTGALGVTPEGNFEGVNILTRPMARAALASRFHLAPEQLAKILKSAFDRLNQVRAQRVPPHRDDKVIAAWNGLAITALSLGPRYWGSGAIMTPRPGPPLSVGRPG